MDLQWDKTPCLKIIRLNKIRDSQLGKECRNNPTQLYKETRPSSRLMVSISALTSGSKVTLSITQETITKAWCAAVKIPCNMIVKIIDYKTTQTIRVRPVGLAQLPPQNSTCTTKIIDPEECIRVKIFQHIKILWIIDINMVNNLSNLGLLWPLWRPQNFRILCQQQILALKLTCTD